MDKPLASVVMPVFNGERFLREAVESVLAQSFTDFEFIIIDDGSTDGTAAMLDSYARSDPRVRVYHQENKGLVESLNRGCGLAQGKYLAIMHADDLAVRNRLRWQIEFMERHADIGVVGGAAETIDSTGRALTCLHPPLDDEDIKNALLHYNPMAHPTVVMRKETFVSVGGYRRFFPAEDYDMWLRIAERWRLANLEAVVLRYRIHPNQASNQKRTQETLCTLAARAFALLRREGKTEPVIPVESITPEDLARLGVDRASQQRALVADCFVWMGLMSRASQDDAALRMMDELIHLSRSGPVDRRIFSNAMLLAARIHHRQGRRFQALALVMRGAIMTGPIVLRDIFWEIFINRTFPLRKRLGLRRRASIERDARPV